jgi:transcription initiation factor TFIID TATA-box-binding protein
MTDVRVENIIASFTLAPSLDLAKLAAILPDISYNPDEVPALVLQFIKPRSVVTFFSTGTVFVTGPKNMDEISDIIKMLNDRLTVVGVECEKTPEVLVQNITVSTELHRTVDLQFLAKSLQNTEYDPKQFPGLVYKGDDPNTVILLFNSGKIVCNGTRLEEITVALDKMMEKLLSFGIRTEENVCQK